MTKSTSRWPVGVSEAEAEYFGRGENIYKEICATLAKEHMGEIVAIDPDCGEYVVGRSELDAVDKAKAKFGDKWVCFFRIGHDAMHKMRGQGSIPGLCLCGIDRVFSQQKQSDKSPRSSVFGFPCSD